MDKITTQIIPEEVKDEEEMLIDTRDLSTDKKVKFDPAASTDKAKAAKPEWPQVNLTTATCSFLKMLIIDEKEGHLVPMFDISIMNLDVLMD